ncbi:hypothetical protein GCM10017673_19880 [Streptosporangium violaceochromogenes]|nr:hypothetical protein GCM10017673_19880 [Streptosporangium violaceochromogenes]
MTSPRLLACALAATLTLSACTLTTPEAPVAGPATAGGVVGAEAGAGIGTALPSALPSGDVPAVTELTPEAYGAELARARTPIRSALGRLNAAGGKGLDRRVEQTAAEVREAVLGLEALVPPAEARAQHGTYAGTLRRFADALQSARQDVQAQKVCTGPAVLTGLKEGGQVAPLLESAAALASLGDYRTDVVPVKISGERSRRLRNGTFVTSESRTGRAYLEVRNGNAQDAVVVLMRGRTKAVTVYVRGKSRFRVQGVRDGRYTAYYALGTDWDARARGFTRSCAFQEFGRPVRFRTVYTGAQIRWNNWTITLNPVVGGTVRSKHIKPGDFPG